MYKNPIYITWIIEEINRYRRYSLYIQPTLFGTYELIRSWGRIGRKMRSMVKAYPTLQEAEREMTGILRQKKRKGYKEAAIGTLRPNRNNKEKTLTTRLN